MEKLILLVPLLLASCDKPSCKSNQVKIGMSESELIALCGETKRNMSINGPTQWVYGGSEELYVYTSNGKVDGKQWSEN